MAVLKLQGQEVATPSVMQWTISSYDNNSSRGLDGTLHRDMVCQKEKLVLEWNCANLSPQEISEILTLTLPAFFEVEYYSPLSASIVKKTMYVSDRETNFYRFFRDGTPQQDSLKFSLVER
jgi:hypothetical protein